MKNQTDRSRWYFIFGVSLSLMAVLLVLRIEDGVTTGVWFSVAYITLWLVSLFVVLVGAVFCLIRAVASRDKKIVPLSLLALLIPIHTISIMGLGVVSYIVGR